ncbi:hypothetical protein FB45DRAFT_960171 [Roridomyces roridus]|uniref:Prolyl 4-hydroxylase alpha subunit domain-containing protein n=1 Tax=Roridomyces roridus TaxID=1738132 RepID=A0AAD7AXY4_9AGAR|nr:hypothetical protein FB45DRAFT_960171 [Roridomyces roridus]
MFAKIFGYGPKYVGPGRIDFAAAGLPEYTNCYATVLDSLFSKQELSAILAAGEASSPSGWQIAQLNNDAGSAYAVTDTSHRKGQRIMYDSVDLSEHIFERIRPHLGDIEEVEEAVYFEDQKAVQKWRMVRMNERLRFLRYPKGGFFKKHIDTCSKDASTGQKTFYTVQFYLPSDSSGSDDSFLSATGGTTRFLGDTGIHADVKAIPGRVLVFQHAKLLHTGEEVTKGVKCTVRCDIFYEKIGDPVVVEE